MADIPVAPKSLSRVEQRRWYVHLGLLLSLAASLLTLITLSHSITAHVIVGVAFMVLLLIHLYQRRRTIASLFKRFAGSSVHAPSSKRLALSDLILALLVANVLLSGIVDGVSHQATQIPILANMGFPAGLVQWHRLAALVLVVYIVVHVVRRRKRLRRSRIR
jgi:hypothetical protein